MTTDLAAEALAGPWQAILSAHGEAMTYADFDGNGINPDRAKIRIVRRSGVPDQFGVMPAERWASDQVVEWDDFETVEQVETRWIQAQAMAAGLNAAAKDGA